MPSLRIQLSALAAAVLGAAAVQAAPSHGGVAAVSSASQTGSGEGDVKIGIMDTISTAVDTASLREGLVLLSNPLEKDFRISWRDIVTPDAAQEVLHQKPDFLMLPTEQIDLMEEQGVQTFRIATRKPWTATDAAHAVGSLVVTRADRTDINTLEDLAGRHIAASRAGLRCRARSPARGTIRRSSSAGPRFLASPIPAFFPPCFTAAPTRPCCPRACSSFSTRVDSSTPPTSRPSA